jgi:hypothetical protein
MQVDLAAAELQPSTTSTEDNRLHAEDVAIESHRPVNIGDRENEVVEPIDAHSLSSSSGTTKLKWCGFLL